MRSIITTIFVYVKGNGTRGSSYSGVVNNYCTAVVGQNILSYRIAIQLHIIQSQVRIVLNQNFSFFSRKSTVLKNYFISLKNLETVGFSTRRADSFTGYIIGVSSKIDSQASSFKFTLGEHNTITIAVIKQGNSVAVFSRINSLFQGGILCCANLCRIFSCQRNT